MDIARPIDQRITTYTDLPSVKIEEYAQKGRDLLQALATFEVHDPTTADTLGTLLKGVHQEIKALDELRLQVGKPAREAQKDINAFFKPALQVFQETKNIITDKLQRYAEEVQRRNREAIEQVAAGSVGALDKIMPETPVSGTSTRKELHVEVMDFDQIPREFLCVDWSALKIHAKKGGEAPPGVRFEWREKVVVGK